MRYVNGETIKRMHVRAILLVLYPCVSPIIISIIIVILIIIIVVLCL